MDANRICVLYFPNDFIIAQKIARTKPPPMAEPKQTPMNIRSDTFVVNSPAPKPTPPTAECASCHQNTDQPPIIQKVETTPTHSVLVLPELVLLLLSTWLLLEAHIVRSLTWRWWGAHAVVCSAEGLVRFVGLGHMHSCLHPLDVSRGEEALLAIESSRPPVGVCFFNDFDDVANREREVVWILRGDEDEWAAIGDEMSTYLAILVVSPQCFRLRT